MCSSGTIIPVYDEFFWPELHRTTKLPPTQSIVWGNQCRIFTHDAGVRVESALAPFPASSFFFWWQLDALMSNGTHLLPTFLQLMCECDLKGIYSFLVVPFPSKQCEFEAKRSAVKWRSSTGQRTYIVHPSQSSFPGRFVNSACLLCASGMAAEQKVCCLGALSRLTHPHPPPPFITMADGSRWILHNLVRTAPPIPIHLFKHISSDGEFTQRLKAATRPQRHAETGRASSSSVIPSLIASTHRCPAYKYHWFTTSSSSLSILTIPSSSPFRSRRVTSLIVDQVKFVSPHFKVMHH